MQQGKLDVQKGLYTLPLSPFDVSCGLVVQHGKDKGKIEKFTKYKKNNKSIAIFKQIRKTQEEIISVLILGVIKVTASAYHTSQESKSRN